MVVLLLSFDSLSVILRKKSELKGQFISFETTEIPPSRDKISYNYTRRISNSQSKYLQNNNNNNNSENGNRYKMPNEFSDGEAIGKHFVNNIKTHHQQQQFSEQADFQR